MSFWSDLLGGVVGSVGIADQYNRVTDLGADVAEGMNTLGSELNDAAQFQPYSVTTNMGGVQVGPGGSTTSALNDFMAIWQNSMLGSGQTAGQYGIGAQDYLSGLLTQDRANQTMASAYGGINNYANQAYSGASGAMGNATSDLSSLQNQMYNDLRAAQTPEEERARLALEERLLAQGRSGVQTAAYGGTPEQLAMEKAIAENRNSAWNQAFGQSQQYQQNQLNTALGLGQQGYAGNQLAQQLASMNVGDIANIAGTGGTLGVQGAQAANAYGQAGMLPDAMLLDYANNAANNAQMAQAGQLGGLGMYAQLGQPVE